MNNGGCPITGYAVYRDDGSGGSFVESNSVGDIAVRNLPSLNSLLITNIPGGSTGKTFRIKVRVFNAAGYLDSPILKVVLASLPLTPPVPIVIPTLTSYS